MFSFRKEKENLDFSLSTQNSLVPCLFYKWHTSLLNWLWTQFNFKSKLSSNSSSFPRAESELNTPNFKNICLLVFVASTFGKQRTSFCLQTDLIKTEHNDQEEYFEEWEEDVWPRSSEENERQEGWDASVEDGWTNVSQRIYHPLVPTRTRLLHKPENSNNLKWNGWHWFDVPSKHILCFSPTEWLADILTHFYVSDRT